MDYSNNTLNGFEQGVRREILPATEGQPESTDNKGYCLRRLCADDIFLMVRLLSKIGIKEFKFCVQDPAISKDLLAAAADEENKEETTDETKPKRNPIAAYGGVLLDVAQILLTNIVTCKGELYALLSSVSDIPVAEMGQMDAAVFANMVIDFCTKEEFKDFYKAALRFVK